MKKLIIVIILLVTLFTIAKKAETFGNSINEVEHTGIEQLELELNK